MIVVAMTEVEGWSSEEGRVAIVAGMTEVRGGAVVEEEGVVEEGEGDEEGEVVVVKEVVVVDMLERVVVLEDGDRIVLVTFWTMVMVLTLVLGAEQPANVMVEETLFTVRVEVLVYPDEVMDAREL
jgi:hypothetical protein